MFIKEEFNSHSDLIISSSRHIALLKSALKSLKEALENTIKGDFIDMVEIDLREAYNFLGEITGEYRPDELVDELFKKFCLGK